MDVAVGHCLARHGSAVHAYVEPRRRRVIGSDVPPHDVCKGLHCAMFAGEQVEVVHDVTSRNDERVKRRDRVAVSDSDRERVLRYQVTVGLVALNTGMRYSELRLLRWVQVDLKRRTVRVGKSKTEASTGRTIPLNDRANKVLQFWSERFPKRKPEDFVFPSERYGAGGDKFEPCVYDTDPTRPINSWKEAWESAKETAKVSIRFHDLRHTCVTRMLEGGAPLSVVAAILGWSAATTVRMAKRYGHIGQVAQRQAVELLDAKPKKTAEEKSRADRPGQSLSH